MHSVEVDHLSKRYQVQKRSDRLRIQLPRLLDLFGSRREQKSEVTRDIWALKDVSFTIDPGEVLGVIGRNGAGKTTLLKVLGRITLPTEGRARIGGRVISLLEIGLGFQDDLTARENIYLNAAIFGVGRKEVKECFDEIIAFADLDKFVDGPPLRHFSTGMYLRLAFSVAVNLKPDVLLADEVLAVGDMSFQNKCMERITKVGKSGATVLFVSHDMKAIEKLCRRCIRLDGGKLVDEGDPSDVVKRYEDEVFTVQTKSQRDVKGYHRNEYGEILSAEILNLEGRPMAVVSTAEGFLLQTTFRTLQPGLSVRCGFELGSGGIAVLRSMQTADVPLGGSGIYQIVCRMPARLLSDIAYTVSPFVAFLHGPDGPINSMVLDDHGLSFRAYNTEEAVDPKASHFKTKAAGVVAPRLDWGGVELRRLSGSVEESVDASAQALLRLGE